VRLSYFLLPRFSPPNSQDLDGYLPYDIKAPLADKVRQSVENSIKDLGSPPDSVVLHREMETIDETLEVLMVLRDLRKEGKITQMTGISNAYDADRLATMVLHEPELIQVISNRWHEANAWDHQIMATVSENGPRKSGYLRHKTDVMYRACRNLATISQATG
jgi:aryl-alcohol dehydrogenase-like predicted oxidoreductase